MLLQFEDLVEYYRKHYEEVGRRRVKMSVRVAGFEKRTASLGKAMKRLHPDQVGLGQLNDWHKQIRNLTHLAYRQHSKTAINEIMSTILPNLARLDIGMLEPSEVAAMDDAFLDYVNERDPDAITDMPLYGLYRGYRRYCIESKMTELVPSRPELEFPKALNMSRRFILHIGPTNSGKTYEALKVLKDAPRGVYLGPLRLLALEVFEQMREYGTPCTMLTGQECIEMENSRVTASTIEMADLSVTYDVAVIDEAQMVSDRDRGHSWTRAILGVLAEEVHVCMSPAAEPAICHLIELCGDNYEIRRYERKTKLVCEDIPFVFPDDIKKGDALIVFSKRSVLDVAGRLEERGVKASVIYGSLPPEIRRQQVQLFAQGSTKVVVATDAIGMGLNLPVRRIVFVQTDKFDGVRRRSLTISEIKQIAGRAGRYGKYDTGYISAMDEESLDFIRERFDAQEDPVERVSLGFPQVLLSLEDPLDVILRVWHDVKPEPPFEKVSIEEILYLYDQAALHRQEIDGFDDKKMLYRMISCPIDIKDRSIVNLWLRYCKTYTADVSLPRPNMKDCREFGIQRYETYYKALDLYYQFSVRMGKVIDFRWLADERARVEGLIMKNLLKGKGEYISMCRYCGRLLPVGFPYAVCNRCRSGAYQRWDDGYGGTVRYSFRDDDQPEKEKRRTTGRKPAGQRSSGQKTAGERVTGQKTAGERVTGQKASGEKAVSQQSAGLEASGAPARASSNHRRRRRGGSNRSSSNRLSETQIKAVQEES